MGISELLTPRQEECLLLKLKEIQVYITEDVFSEDNFHFVFKYISKGREKALLKKKDNEPASPTKKLHKIKRRIEGNFMQYEVIKRMLNPSIKSLT